MNAIAVCRLLLAALCLLALLPSAAFAQTGERCFPETGFCISGQFRWYWETGGGIPLVGYPITAVTTEIVDGVPLQVQWFERDRVQIKPDGAIIRSRLGAERLKQLGGLARDPGGALAPGRIMYRAIGYTVCGDILDHLRVIGDLFYYRQAYTGEIQETIVGKLYTVQYFAYAHIERHSDLPGSPLILGLLGREVHNALPDGVTLPE
jgi:hypothetical protein